MKYNVSNKKVSGNEMMNVNGGIADFRVGCGVGDFRVANNHDYDTDWDSIAPIP